MKILVVDRDDLSAQLIASKLEPVGHSVVLETVKNDALERLSSEEFHLIFADPSPLSDPAPLVLNMRRAMGRYPYVVLMTREGSREAALKAGCNDFLPKPFDAAKLDVLVDNAQRLLKLIQQIGDDSEDFPSAGGIIAKSAFNQLFLSSIDRADRYGESSFILFISVNNYSEIMVGEGQYEADCVVAKLSQYLVRLRRQSDIIGQISANEYALLLQGSTYEKEPMEAAARFAESLSSFGDIASSGANSVEIKISLVNVPAGAQPAEYIFTPGQS